jgi:hypothetical protein
MVPEKPITDRQTQGTPGRRSTSSGRKGFGCRAAAAPARCRCRRASAASTALAVDSSGSDAPPGRTRAARWPRSGEQQHAGRVVGRVAAADGCGFAATRHAPRRQQAQRQVGQEQPAPVAVVDDEAADHRPADAGDREHGREVALVARPLPGRHQLADERLRQHHQAAAAQALQHARGDQPCMWAPGRRPASPARTRQRGQHHVAPAEAVAHAAVQRRGDGGRQQVADRRSRRCRTGRRGRARCAGVAGGQQGLVDRAHEHRQHDRAEQREEGEHPSTSWPTTSKVATPPTTTEPTGRTRRRSRPTRTRPSWLLAPMNIELTAPTRPRISSGVSSCTSVCRTTTLTMSAPPDKRQRDQRHQEPASTGRTPACTRRRPPPTAAASGRRRLRIGWRVSRTDISSAPTAGAARSAPRPDGPTCRMSLA